MDTKTQNGFCTDEERPALVQKLVDKHVCISKAEARRWTYVCPKHKIEERIRRVHKVRYTGEQQGSL